jgi:hypothetical protein
MDDTAKIDTDAILLDIDRAETKTRDFLDDGVTVSRDARLAVKELLDQWAYLRHVLTEGAPLPAEWAQAQQLRGRLGDLCEEAWVIISNGTGADPASGRWQEAATAWRHKWFAVLADADLPDGQAVRPGELTSRADEQLDHLRKAADAVAAQVPALAYFDDETQAKVEHLVGCVSAVDHMCSRGDLPSEWRRDVVLAASETAIAVVPAALDWAAAWAAEFEPTRDLGPARLDIKGHSTRFGMLTVGSMFGERYVRITPEEGGAPEFYPVSSIHRLSPAAPSRDPWAGPDTPSDPFGEGFSNEDPF